MGDSQKTFKEIEIIETVKKEPFVSNYRLCRPSIIGINGNYRSVKWWFAHCGSRT
jgi:hypothetical protein